jgi:hypothetical protein
MRAWTVFWVTNVAAVISRLVSLGDQGGDMVLVG